MPSRSSAKRNSTIELRLLWRRRPSSCTDHNLDFYFDARGSDWQRRCKRAWPAPRSTAAIRHAGCHQFVASVRASSVEPLLPQRAAQVRDSHSIHKIICVCIRMFLEDAESFLEMYERPSDRWARFILSWLNSNKAENLDFAVKNFVPELRENASLKYLQHVQASRSIAWQKAIIMVQACELARTCDKSLSNAGIANVASSAKLENYAQSSTTSSNYGAITTPCASVHPWKLRRNNNDSSSTRASKGNWRACNSKHTSMPAAPLVKILVCDKRAKQRPLK